MKVIFLLLYTICIVSTISKGGDPNIMEISPTMGLPVANPQTKLSIQNVDMATFQRSLTEKNTYATTQTVVAGVIPHHLLAAPMISGFFTLVSKNTFDTVVIVAPNHNGDLGDLILSDADWTNGVSNDQAFLQLFRQQSLPGIQTVINNQRIQEDHSASVHIPYVAHYCASSNVFPILISKSMSLEKTLSFANALTKTIQNSNKKVLLLCSIDFSHYLPRVQALERDTQTLHAIQNRDYPTLFHFSNNNVDSPGTLVTFLEYLRLQGLSLEILDHQDATQFSNMPAVDTTTYFILGGSQPN